VRNSDASNEPICTALRPGRFNQIRMTRRTRSRKNCHRTRHTPRGSSCRHCLPFPNSCCRQCRVERRTPPTPFGVRIRLYDRQTVPSNASGSHNSARSERCTARAVRLFGLRLRLNRSPVDGLAHRGQGCARSSSERVSQRSLAYSSLLLRKRKRNAGSSFSFARTCHLIWCQLNRIETDAVI
jgi:hypothetical protein